MVESGSVWRRSEREKSTSTTGPMNIRSHGPDLDSIGNDTAFGFFWPGVCSVSLTRFDSTNRHGACAPGHLFHALSLVCDCHYHLQCFDTRGSAHDTRSFRLFVPPILVRMSDCSKKTMFNCAFCSIFVLVFRFLALSLWDLRFQFFCFTFSSTLKVISHTLVLLVFGFSLDFQSRKSFKSFQSLKSWNIFGSTLKSSNLKIEN